MRISSFLMAARSGRNACKLIAMILVAGVVGTTSAQEFLANKKFNPTEITANTSTQLTFELFNATTGSLSSTLTDTLPATAPAGQLWYSADDIPAALTVAGIAGCTSGAVTLSDWLDAPTNSRARTITIANATVPSQPGGSATANCEITVPVHYGGVSADTNLTNQVPAGGAYAIDAGSNRFDSEAFEATLLVRRLVDPITVRKEFARTIVAAGGATTLTIRVTNTSSPAVTLNNVTFDDNLQNGLLTSGAPSFSPTCGAASSTTGANASVVNVSGATIAPGDVCVITVPVTAPAIDGPVPNTIPVGGVTATGGHSNGAAASATLNVRNTIKMTKAFVSGGTARTNTLPEPASLYGATLSTGNTLVETQQPVLVRVYFSNPRTTALEGGNLTDNLPLNVVALGGTAGGTCTYSPSAPTITAGASSVNVSSFSVPAANATTGALGSCYVEFYVKPTATFALQTNSLSTSSVSFTGSPTIDASTSANLVATSQQGGAYNLTVEKLFSKGSTTQTGATSAPLRVEKGEEFWMRVRVRNLTYDRSFANGSVVDTLPLGVQVAVPNDIRVMQSPPSVGGSSALGCGDQTAALTGTDGAVGVVVLPDTRQQITYSGFTVHSGAAPNTGGEGCYFAIKLVSNVDGDYVNTIDARAFTADDGATNLAAVSARVAVMSELDTTKAFSPTSIGAAGGGLTRLTLSFTNKNTVTAITGLSVTDNLPVSATLGSLLVADPANAANTCGGTVAAEAGSASVGLTDGTVSPGSTCTVAVDIVHQRGNGSTTGALTNSIPAGAVSNDQNQTNPLPITADLNIRNMGVTVNKSFDSSSALGGRSVRLTISIAATSGSTFGPQENIVVTDPFPSGMLAAPSPNYETTCVKNDGTTPATVAIAGDSSSVTVSGFDFATYTNGAAPHNRCYLALDVVLTTTGNKTNIIAAQTVSSDAGTTNATATSASLSALPNTTLQKSFAPPRIEVGAPSTLTLTVVNVNSSPRTDFTLTDTLPAGMVLYDDSASTTCGDGIVTAPAGSGVISVSGADVAPNSTCTVTAQVTMRSVATLVNDGSNIEGPTYLDTTETGDELESYASSLRGTVFVDPDNNGGSTGYQPPTDSGVGGVTVTLQRNGDVVATATTVSAAIAAGGTFTNMVNGEPVSCPVPAPGLEIGQYLFCNLQSGSGYSVVETQPPGYTSTGNRAGNAGGTPGAIGGSSEAIDGIVLASEQDATGYDFGEYAHDVTNVSGRVYRETGGNTTDDGNGIDPGLVTRIEIACTGPETRTPAFNGSMDTGADGSYSFTGMLPGASCVITEAQPDDHSNAYTQSGPSGEPPVAGSVDGSAYGLPGDSVITITVPAAGSPNNNFAEVRLADMSSSTSCTPTAGSPGTLVTCTVTCVNGGPNSAENVFCAVSNAADLPGAPTPVCVDSPTALLPAGASLSCTVAFAIPNSPPLITVRGGTGADNDTDGGAMPVDGNNPSQVVVTPQLAVPTLGTFALLLLGLMLTGLALHRR